ncbi:MAG TPA: asparagine synthase C-terminal domain-containing protein, partial [Thermoanaerobaculia bacterium]|nr:asparagine synthase C-terminal domain-containing protein [Thermoanaerobaculia bacterium]
TIASSGARSSMHTWWSAKATAERAAAGRFSGSDAEALDTLDALLADSVRLRMLSDVPLGVFLSGGIDSSLVTAVMRRESSAAVSTFTIGFEDPEADETARAAAIATHLETSHHELHVSSKDALDAIPLMPSVFDEPFADSSQIPTFLVSRLARPFVTVALSGDGGDELFGGYHHYFLGRKLIERVESVPIAIRPLLARTLRRVPKAAWSVLSRHAPLRRLRGNIADRAGRLAAALEESDPVRLHQREIVNRVPLAAGDSIPPTVLTTPDAWPRLGDPIELLMFLDFAMYLPDDILVKVDRASMAVSLEAREPLLDHRLIEFAWSLPLDMKLRHGKGKWILRQLLRRFLPDDLVDREKRGFGLPLAAWLRGPLRDWAEPLLSDPSLGDFYDVATVDRLWREHLDGEDRQALIWNVLMFQAWRKEWRM